MKYIIAKIIEFAAICAVAIILIKMGYGGGVFIILESLWRK